jgi:hypothetical protein
MRSRAAPGCRCGSEPQTRPAETRPLRVVKGLVSLLLTKGEHLSEHLKPTGDVSTAATTCGSRLIILTCWRQIVLDEQPQRAAERCDGCAAPERFLRWGQSLSNGKGYRMS